MRDYGFNPLGNGKYKMIPSGDIVDAVERDKRIPRPDMSERHDVLPGYTWEDIDNMQQKRGSK